MKPEQITATLRALTTDQLIAIISRQAEYIVKQDRKLIELMKDDERAKPVRS